MILLLVLLDVMGVLWIVEQPKGSVMQHNARFEWFIGSRTVYKHGFNMYDFGGASEKGTWVYSNKAWIAQLDLYRPANLPVRQKKALTDSWRDTTGKQRVQGNKNTKSSQAYPPQFGEALACLVDAHAEDMAQDCMQAREHFRQVQADCAVHHMVNTHSWSDAELGPVLSALAE